MTSPGREPSMEDILASIKKVIAEEKEMRAQTSVSRTDADFAPDEHSGDHADDVLELDEPLAPPMDLGPPLLDESVAETSRESIQTLAAVAASAPPPPPMVNPLEELVRDMLRPMLKQWLDDNLRQIIDEHVKREISRITGRPL